MERKLTTISPFYAATAAVLTLTAVVAGLRRRHEKRAAGQPSGSTRQAVSGKTAGGLAGQVAPAGADHGCGAASCATSCPPPRRSSILHARTAPPVYTSHPGVAVTCQWIKRGQGRASGAQLYVGISASINWTGTQAVDRSLHSKPVTIDGHAALAATRRGTISWAQVDVALGGGDDPVAEYRAPTMAAAQALARAATPHIIALG